MLELLRSGPIFFYCHLLLNMLNSLLHAIILLTNLSRPPFINSTSLFSYSCWRASKHVAHLPVSLSHSRGGRRACLEFYTDFICKDTVGSLSVRTFSAVESKLTSEICTWAESKWTFLLEVKGPVSQRVLASKCLCLAFWKRSLYVCMLTDFFVNLCINCQNIAHVYIYCLFWQ